VAADVSRANPSPQMDMRRRPHVSEKTGAVFGSERNNTVGTTSGRGNRGRPRTRWLEGHITKLTVV